MYHRRFRPHQRQTQTTLKDVVKHPIVLGIWVIGCLIITYQLLTSLWAIYQSKERFSQAERRVQQEEVKGLELIEELEKAKSPLEREKMIRDELNMQKEGETVIQLPK